MASHPFSSRPSSTYHYPRITDHGPSVKQRGSWTNYYSHHSHRCTTGSIILGGWSTDHGSSNAEHGPIKMNCVPIVARLRQIKAEFLLSRCCRDVHFTPFLLSRLLSRFSKKYRDFKKGVTECLDCGQNVALLGLD